MDQRPVGPSPLLSPQPITNLTPDSLSSASERAIVPTWSDWSLFQVPMLFFNSGVRDANKRINATSSGKLKMLSG